MLLRRLLVFAVVLLGLAVLAAAVAERPSETPVRSGPAVSPGPPEISGRPPSAQAGPVRVADVPGEPPLRRLDAGKGFDPIEVEVGQRVRLAISNTRVGSVQVGRDGPIESIDPVSPARFDLLYSTPGRQEVRLYGPGLSDPRVIGALEVTPAR